MPLSTQLYKCVPANLMLGVTLRLTNIPSRGGVEILLVSSCYRNRGELRSDGPLGSYADLTFLPTNFTSILYSRCLSQVEGLFLKSVIAEFRSSGLEEATFGDVS